MCSSDLERDAALARLAALRERLAALEPVAEQAARREALEAELAAMVEEGKGLRARTGAMGVEVARRAVARAELAERIAALLKRRRGLAATAGRVPAMAAARAERATLVEQRRAPLEAPIPEVEPDLAPLRSRVGALRDALAGRQATARTAAAALAAATARQARLEGEGAALGEPAAEAARLAAAEAAAVEAGADWRVLARDLGPNGLQALEIELAGPAVSQIANALLAACYGSRFALALETLAERKTGAGTKDIFEVRLLDSATGRVGTEGSGGEQVILDEALRLALALYNQQRSGGALRTLFRDEVDGQLDPENAHRYVGMLRRAVALGGLHRVVFISHRPEVWAQADARLVVADGTATVDPPPALGAAA